MEQIVMNFDSAVVPAREPLKELVSWAPVPSPAPLVGISEGHRRALEALEQMYGLALGLAEKLGLDEIDEGIVKIKIGGRYSHGTWTIDEVLDRADEVLEHAKGFGS
jgi:hypothetical protein